ncbi:hypothetical protein NCAST_08_00740 [Nocardia asteroides NBRC 15531]|uniref:Uncharacterized protein n=1 Tax=Nocardia asteroides NBRC 15531 TaxID=1110697 RepID=U5E3A7_NOCAS|nr:hypothetical protein NCAST_08_00740 [Nocardia asteroides NBRC 15531]
MPSDNSVRHLDPGPALWSYAELILVACPKCGGRATNLRRPGLPAARYWNQYYYEPRRLICDRCGAVADWSSEHNGSRQPGARQDPHFGLPLWLQTRCCGRVLWAYNAAQVDELSAYVSALLRERSRRNSSISLVSQMPLWMKRADNRAEVSAGLARLRTLAGRSEPADRSDAAY